MRGDDFENNEFFRNKKDTSRNLKLLGMGTIELSNYY